MRPRSQHRHVPVVPDLTESLAGATGFCALEVSCVMRRVAVSLTAVMKLRGIIGVSRGWSDYGLFRLRTGIPSKEFFEGVNSGFVFVEDLIDGIDEWCADICLAACVVD